MKKTILWATTAAVMISGTAMAGGPEGRGGPGLLGPEMMRILSELKLTPNQEQLVEQMREDMKTRRRAMMGNHKDDLATIAAELEKSSPDPTALKAMADKRLDEQRALAHQRIDDFMKLHATLTPEQRKTLAKELAAMPEKHRKMWKKRFQGQEGQEDGEIQKGLEKGPRRAR